MSKPFIKICILMILTLGTFSQAKAHHLDQDHDHGIHLVDHSHHEEENDHQDNNCCSFCNLCGLEFARQIAVKHTHPDSFQYSYLNALMILSPGFHNHLLRPPIVL